MKKILILVLTLIIASCTDSIWDSSGEVPKANLIIEETKNLWEKQENLFPKDLRNAIIDWDKSTIFKTVLGNNFIAIPLERKGLSYVNEKYDLKEFLIMKNDDFKNLSESFILQIFVENKSFTNFREVIENFESDTIPGFSGVLITKSLNGENGIGQSFRDGKFEAKSFSNIRGSNSKGERVNTTRCWDMVRTIYWSDQTVTEEVLYTLCIDSETEDDAGGGGGSGGGTGGTSGDPGDPCLADPGPVGTNAQFMSEGFTAVSSLDRTKIYRWKSVLGVGWDIVSSDVGVHKRLNTSSAWKWHSLTHSSVNVEGAVIGFSVAPSVTFSNATIGEYYANMYKQIYVTFSFICSGSPINISNTYSSNMNFHVNGGN